MKTSTLLVGSGVHPRDRMVRIKYHGLRSLETRIRTAGCQDFERRCVHCGAAVASAAATGARHRSRSSIAWTLTCRPTAQSQIAHPGTRPKAPRNRAKNVGEFLEFMPIFRIFRERFL
jgi:hypothetical protein